VHVHHDDAVLPLEGGLGGTHPDAGGIGAVVAQHQEGHVLHFFRHVRRRIPGKGVVEMLGPQPLNFIAPGHRGVEFQLVIRGVDEIRDIMHPVADGGALLGGSIIQFFLVDHHGPAFGLQRTRSRDDLGLYPAGRQ
jgi:hypothetical protein